MTVENAFQKKQTRLVQLTKVMMGTFRRLATHNVLVQSFERNEIYCFGNWKGKKFHLLMAKASSNLSPKSNQPRKYLF